MESPIFTSIQTFSPQKSSLENYQNNIELNEVIEQLQLVLNKEKSREEVAQWASAWIISDLPTVEDEKTWKLLKLATGCDLEILPNEYLHSEEEIYSWIHPLIENPSSR